MWKVNKSHPATPLISYHLPACTCKHGAHFCLHFHVSSLSLKSAWPEISAWFITFCLMPTPEGSSPWPPYLKLTLFSLHILFVLIFCLIFLYSFVFLRIKFGPVFLISYIFRISFYLVVSFPTFMLHFTGKMYIIKILNAKKFP